MPPRRRPERSERSLVCLIQSLEGRRVVIELRNDMIVRALLETVDDFMRSVHACMKRGGGKEGDSTSRSVVSPCAPRGRLGWRHNEHNKHAPG